MGIRGLFYFDTLSRDHPVWRLARFDLAFGSLATFDWHFHFWRLFVLALGALLIPIPKATDHDRSSASASGSGHHNAMMTPGGRRRRLIQAFAPSNAYSSVPSSTSSFREAPLRGRRRGTQGKSEDSRKQRPSSAGGGNTKTKNTIPTGFRPIDPTAEHGYRIDVAKDGSMITAVPIDEQPGVVGGGGSKNLFKSPQRPLRTSPVMFTQPRASPNGSTTTWSTQGLLDARGKQRHKMKRMRPGAASKTNTTATATAPTRPTKTISDNDSSFPNDPFNNVLVHTARDKLKQAKGFLAFTGGTNNNNNSNTQQQQQRIGELKNPPTQPPASPNSRPRKTKVRWDLSPKRQYLQQPMQQPQSQSPEIQVTKSNSGNLMDDMSFSSFPMLSPTHKFDDGNSSPREEENNSDNVKVTTVVNKNITTKKKANRSHHHDANNINSKNGQIIEGTNSFEDILQQRMIEIQLQQRVLAGKISKKDVIKGTLITAIDSNLERNRKQMLTLENELTEIQWHLKMDSKKKHQNNVQQNRNTKNNVLQNRNDGARAAPRLARNPSGAYDMESVDVGDPSITADTDSVIAALYRKDNKARLDPPARPNPPTSTTLENKELLHPIYRRETKEPDGPRLSAVLRGDEQQYLGFGDEKEPDGHRISAVLRGDEHLGFVEANERNVVRENNNGRTAPPKSAPIRPIPSKERPPLQYHQYEQPRQHYHPWQKRRFLPPPQSQKQGKFVNFNLPGTDSDELKFESTNSTEDSPSTDFVDAALNGDGNDDDISWKGEHFDVDAYDEETGSFISSEHHDMYQWRDEDHRVMVSEHYSRESHHIDHHHEVTDGKQIPVVASSNKHNKNYNGNNRGVSSDSVETDPDLGFIHAVAAVVIQTAVRRFLAEIAIEERLYAVNVIQTAICNWMAHKRNPYYHNSGDEVYHDDQNSNRIFHDEQQQHCSYSKAPTPPQRIKRVMFEDDYNEFRDFAATEIQRCFRGWGARDGLEVDHYAATTIQRIFRGWWAMEGIDVDRYCAIEIQRIVRGYLARMTYIYDLYCIIVAQSVARRYLSFYTSAVRLANILYIQAIYRGYRVRAELRRYVRNGQEVAATFIQSQWRSYDAQMNYINNLADILIVQSVARRWLTLRKMRKRYGFRPKQDTKMGYGQSGSNYNQNNAAPIQQRNTHATWQQHRLNIVSKPPSPKRHSEGFPDVFHRDSVGAEDWYDGNKSETSDMLRGWKGRKSR